MKKLCWSERICIYIAVWRCFFTIPPRPPTPFAAMFKCLMTYGTVLVSVHSYSSISFVVWKINWCFVQTGSWRRTTTRCTMCSCTDPPTLPRSFATWLALLRSPSSVPDPDPHVFRILLSASKNSKKNLDFHCFVISFGTLNLWRMM